MDVTNFISPLETVQMISIFSYVNTLSDFLFAEKYLEEQDQYKHIPVVNALYHYMYPHGEHSHTERKINLARRLINGTDLYGAKINEALDLRFLNTLFNHIIGSLVFEKFTNVYGFIAETVRSVQSDSFIPVMHKLKMALVGMKFENEFGEDSELYPLAVENIFVEIILPLFPEPQKMPVKVTSLDYIYAQAGKMFVRSGQRDESFGEENTPIGQAQAKFSQNQADDQNYQDFIEIAHTIEQLVLAKKLNESVLKIFALPALINYVYKEKMDLKSESIAAIIKNPIHWRKAYKHLFTYLSDAFLSMQRVQNNNYQYVFYSALSNYRNRTTLAREIIEINCLDVSVSEMETEVNRYKNNPDAYTCRQDHPVDDNKRTIKNKGLVKPLYDLNKLYQEQVKNITNNYYIYEKESCRAVFGNKFIKSLDKANVIVSKGLIRYYSFGYSALETESVQLVKPSHDLLQFYYPENDTYTYYALIRKGYSVSLITEGDPINFRKALGLDSDQTFRNNYFPTVLKEKNERFEIVFTKIAKERSELFGANLESSGYDETRKEWWTNFGLSLIPFYSCVKDITNNDYRDAITVCPMDALFFIPVVGEMEVITSRIASASTRLIATVSETTLRTITVRTSIRTILRNTGRALIEEMGEFTRLFRIEMFRDFGISLLRFVDPGFELVFSLGKDGLRSIRNVLTVVGRKHSMTSRSLKGTLEGMETAIDNLPKKVNRLFGKDVYVNSLTKDSAYGYKFIPLKSGQVAEIRTVYPKGEEIPLIVQESKMYNQVDLETEEIIGKDYFDEDGIVASEEKHFELYIKEEGEHLPQSPDFEYISEKTFEERFAEALDYASKNPNLPESTVRNELKKYAFPINGKTELDFVKEWTSDKDLKIPEWSIGQEIDEPEIFYKLRETKIFTSPEISFEDANSQLEVVYPFGDNLHYKMQTISDRVFEDYIFKKAFESLTLEDYFALRHYGGIGYKNIGTDTSEARRMKNAIYRLAIKQSEDSIEEYSKFLFRGEVRETNVVEQEFYPGRKEFTFERFTSTSSDKPTAFTFASFSGLGFRKIIYEMKFPKPYLRAKVENLFSIQEFETILLPGTKFKIDEILWENESRDYITVKLTHESVDKAKWQKAIMTEIKKLKESNTVFYGSS